MVVLQDVFGLFLHVFRRLENPAAPSFQLCLSVLDCVSQVLQSCLWVAFQHGYCSSVGKREGILTIELTILQTKCCLLALDFGTDGTVCDIFELILDVIK